jgi:hypothetical protein
MRYLSLRLFIILFSVAIICIMSGCQKRGDSNTRSEPVPYETTCTRVSSDASILNVYRCENHEMICYRISGTKTAECHFKKGVTGE